MRKITVIIGLMVSILASAQSLSLDAFAGYTHLPKFYQGCLKIREGEKTGDLAAYEDAMVLLRERNGYSKKGLNLSDLVVVPIDTTAQLSTDGRAEFTYGYAKAKANMTPYVADHAMRAVQTPCRVKHIAIKPNAKVVFRDEALINDCILLVVAAQPQSKIKVSVVNVASGVAREGESYEDGAVGFLRWTQDAKSDVNYVIENLSDEVVSVAIAAN